MNTRKQTLVALGLVAAAGGTIALYTALASDGGGSSMAAGHNHGAAATTGAQGGGPVHLSAERARRIGVTYAEARVQTLGATIRSVGNVTYDETRLAIVNPKIEGWVERLYVDFTGAPVTRGQPPDDSTQGMDNKVQIFINGQRELKNLDIGLDQVDIEHILTLGARTDRSHGYRNCYTGRMDSIRLFAGECADQFPSLFSSRNWLLVSHPSIGLTGCDLPDGAVHVVCVMMIREHAERIHPADAWLRIASNRWRCRHDCRRRAAWHLCRSDRL